MMELKGTKKVVNSLDSARTDRVALAIAGVANKELSKTVQELSVLANTANRLIGSLMVSLEEREAGMAREDIHGLHSTLAEIAELANTAVDGGKVYIP